MNGNKLNAIFCMMKNKLKNDNFNVNIIKIPQALKEKGLHKEIKVVKYY
jgi:hypothetical protein